MSNRYRVVTQVDSELNIVFEGALDELIERYGADPSEKPITESMAGWGNLSVQTYVEEMVGEESWNRCADPRES